MSKIIQIFILCFFPLLGISQTVITKFYNKEWVEQEKKGYYKREITQISDSLFEVKDFVKGKNLDMVGYFCTIEPEIEHGEFKFYDKKGQIKKIEYFNKGELIGNHVSYINGKKRDFPINYDFSYQVEERNSNDKDYSIPTQNQLDHMPQYKGGDLELRKYVAMNTVYPLLARKYGKHGQVYVTFMISDNGEISDVKVTESVYKDLDKEAVRIIKSLPDWQSPKIIDNKPSSFTMPIRFFL